MFITQLHLLSNQDANTSRFDFDWRVIEIFENKVVFNFFLGLQMKFLIVIYMVWFCWRIVSYSNYLIQIILLNYIKKINIRFLYFRNITILLIIIQYAGIFNAGTAINIQNLIPLQHIFLYLIEFEKLKIISEK